MHCIDTKEESDLLGIFASLIIYLMEKLGGEKKS